MYKFSVRVYYEDTDAGGVVYYANYLKFAERARTEVLNKAGISQRQLADKQDTLFVVRSCLLNCLAPAYLDDVLEVRTNFESVGRVKVKVNQSILRHDKIIATLEVVLACINSRGKPVKINDKLRHIFEQSEPDLEK